MRSLPTFSKVLVFIGLLLCFSALSGFVGQVLAGFLTGEQFTLALDAPLPSGPGGWSSLNISMATSQIVGFGGAVWMYLRLFGGTTGWSDLRWRAPSALNTSSARIWLLSIVATLTIAPLLLWSFNLNAALIPEGGALESFARPLEDYLERMTTFMLTVDGLGLRAVMLIVVALLPALFEELAFRGVLQPLMIQLTGRPWVGIIVTATIFSFIHFQFYGFLPRILLGLLFGWLVYRTGSLWPAILAHFVNNATAALTFWATGTIDSPELPLLSLYGLGITAVFVAALYGLSRSSASLATRTTP